jgi:hypothetical protein
MPVDYHTDTHLKRWQQPIGGSNLIGDSTKGLKRMPVMQSAVDFAAADARVDNVGQSVPAQRILTQLKKV